MIDARKVEEGLTYKEFVKWCDDRLDDNTWLPSEALLCFIARTACSRKWFGREKFWNEVYRNKINTDVIQQYEARKYMQKKQQEAVEGYINFKEMGLDRYEVLCALYNNSHPLGLGMLHFVPGDLTIAEAHTILDDSRGYADYVNGRVIKAKLPHGCESFSPRLYDRDNGEGAALRALKDYAKRKGM